MRDSLGLLLSILPLITPGIAAAHDLIIPAGTLVQCRLSEPSFSSKSAELDDPVLCHVSPGRSLLPYGTYLVGRFEDYRDPGHFIGKGWMQLNFERMVLPGRIVPLSAKVVYVPGLPVDQKGRIRGKGHPVRDIVEWSIPVLWPIKVLTLPARGPRPRLKGETRLTIKVMDDVIVPEAAGAANPLPTSMLEGQQFTFGARMALSHPFDGRFGASSEMAMEPSSGRLEVQPQIPASDDSTSGRKKLTLLILKNGRSHLVADYWFEGGQRIRFTSADGTYRAIPIESLDYGTTVEVNEKRGTTFVVRSERIEDKN
jgi:hypothetical protein